ncbi:MAG TPA: hypothetical protein VIR05_03170 [Luteimonas sp.]
MLGAGQKHCAYPVVESEQSQKLLGVVSRSDLLKPARQLYEEESRRERFLRR